MTTRILRRAPLIAAQLGLFAILGIRASALAQTGEDCIDCIPIGDGATAGSTVGLLPSGVTTCGANSPDIWYCYTASTSCSVTADTCAGASFDTRLSVFDACGGTQLACNDDSCGLQSRLTWSVSSGNTYYIRVSAFGATTTGTFTLTVTPATPPAVESGPIVNPANNHSYYRLVLSDWQCAELAAVALGGHLATIDDGDENEWVRVNITGGNACFIGFNDIAVEGTFEWASGDVVGYTNWNAGEPNNSGNEDVAEMSATTGGWNDLSAAAQRRAVVEIGVPNDGEDCTTCLGITPGTTFGSTAGRVAGPGGCDVGDTIDVWYCYTAGAGECTLSIDTCGGGTNYDTTLAVYDGCDGNLLACNDDASCGFGGLASRVVVGVRTGATYRIRVSGFDGGSGDFELSLSTGGDPVVIAGPVRNPENNSDYYLLSASPWECAERAAQQLGGHLTSIEHFDENQFVQDAFGSTGDLWIGLNDVASEGTFVWTDGEPLGYVNWAAGEPNDQGGEDVVAMSGLTGQWNDVSASLAPENIRGVVQIRAGDACENPILVTDGTYDGDNLLASGTDITSCALNDPYDVWYAYTPDEGGCQALAETCGSPFDTTLAVYDACGGAEVACNDDACGLQSRITWVAQAGTTYYVRVAGYQAARGTFTLRLASGVAAIPIAAGPIVNPSNNHTYYRLNPASWTASEALAQCLGGHLVTINDADEESWVLANMGGGFRIWLGLNDAAEEGNFVWASGEPVSYTRWAAGEPNDGGGTGEDYVEIHGGGWNDLRDTPGVVVAGVVEVGPSSLLGDSNCDGAVDNGDIDCFVAALLDGTGELWRACALAVNPDCTYDFVATNDLNHDTAVDNADIDSFVDCLLNSPLPGEGCP